MSWRVRTAGAPAGEEGAVVLGVKCCKVKERGSGRNGGGREGGTPRRRKGVKSA